MVQMTDILASPEREGCSRRVLSGRGQQVTRDGTMYEQLGISIWNMPRRLFRALFCQFGDDVLERQQPAKESALHRG